MDRQTARLYRYQIQGVKSACGKLTTGAKCLVVNVWYQKKKEKEIKKKRGGKKEWKPCDVQWS